MKSIDYIAASQRLKQDISIIVAHCSHIDSSIHGCWIAVDTKRSRTMLMNLCAVCGMLMLHYARTDCTQCTELIPSFVNNIDNIPGIDNDWVNSETPLYRLHYSVDYSSSFDSESS